VSNYVIQQNSTGNWLPVRKWETSLCYHTYATM